MKRRRAFTLIEMVIYISIFSMTLYSCIQYIGSAAMRDLDLRDRVIESYEEKGFAAFITVILMSIGLWVAVLTTSESVHAFVDMVDRRELRILARENMDSCEHYVGFLIRDDKFISGNIEISQLGCMAHIDAIGNLDGNILYHVQATATLEYFVENRDFDVRVPY